MNYAHDRDDPPVHQEPFWFLLNRAAEHFARWLQLFGLW